MPEMLRVLVLNGPNLNTLGTREPAVYGTMTLTHIQKELEVRGKELNATITCYQSNYEGGIIDTIQEHAQTVDGIIINQQ